MTEPPAARRGFSLATLIIGEWLVFCLQVAEEVVFYHRNTDTWTTRLFHLSNYEEFRDSSWGSIAFATTIFALLLIKRRTRAARVGFAVVLGIVSIFSAAICIVESLLGSYVPGLFASVLLVVPWTVMSAVALRRGTAH